ncbi:MAG: hypothetical protein IJQ69_08930 [Bacteroidales bacterium]|nr:hypothetical protein [Bacteroidales bacterium]
MKKLAFFSFCLFLVIACVQEKLDVNSLSEETCLKQSETILSFDDERSFWNAVEKQRRDKDSPILTKSDPDGFVSIYDEFRQAMIEADRYYQRIGGYEEFKNKYPDLFYPEYGEDFAAFLPVSDEVVAKFLNRQCKVLINGTERDMRDVTSYEKVLELGLGMPDVQTVKTRAISDIAYLTLEKQIVNEKRKAWITLRGIADNENNVKIGRVDLCFRKKGILGWYNGMMSSTSYYYDHGNHKIYYPGGTKNLEYSPHKYGVAARPLSATTSNLGSETFYFECDTDPVYSFTGVYAVDMDALLDLDNGTGFWEDVAGFFNTHNVGAGIVLYF